MLKKYLKKIVFVISFSFSVNVFALNLHDIKSKDFKGKDYKLSFVLEPSDHSTKNTLSVHFDCLNSKKTKKKKKALKEHEVCNINYKSVALKKTSEGYVLEYSPLMKADWHKFYKAMNKGKDVAPVCSKRSKERFVIKLDQCK